MSTILQHRRGTTSAIAVVAPAAGEIFVDTTKNTLVLGDGGTLGGFPMAKEADTQKSASIVAIAGGTADAITGAFSPAIAALTAGLTLLIRAGSANATTTPTFKADGTTAKTIVKGNNLSLIAGDIAGAGHWLELTYDSTLDKWILKNPAAGITSTSGMPGQISYFAMNSAPTGWLKANGAAISRNTYASLFAAVVKSATATISIATPGVVTWAGHGLSANDPVKFTTTGAVPTGLTAGTTYYVVGSSITTNTFQLSATAGGSAIATSGTQSGVHTAINAPWGDGDGSTTFNVPDLRGEFARGWDDSKGTDPSRAFGSTQTGAVESHTHSLNAVISDSGTAYNLSGTAARGAAISATGSYGSTETRPRNIALLACIKY